MTKFLHIANPDKFSIPLCELLTSSDKNKHVFLFTSKPSNEVIFTKDSVYNLNGQNYKNFLHDCRLFYLKCKQADVIIMHGGAGKLYFALFPWFTRKMVWAIHGAELYSLLQNKKNNFKGCLKKILYQRTLGKSQVHLTHIQGDSILANEIFKSNRKFHYSPMYLSNTVSVEDFRSTTLTTKVKILVGNSNSSNNNHVTILQHLKKYEESIDCIISPLNYGSELEYKQRVKEEGFKLFGDKFKPVEEFMSIDKYKEMLCEIDIAVFDHWRQEAMGVTMLLLSLGKIIYMNPNTTSYENLKKRGFQIFDNMLLFESGPLEPRDVGINKELLSNNYSLEVLIDSYENIQL